MTTSTESFDLYTQANTAFQQRQWPNAYDLALRQLRRTPQHAPSHYLAGFAALELNRWSEALTHSQRAAQLGPAQVEYLVHFAKALSLTNKPGHALQMANRAMALAPSDPQLLYTLGTIYNRSNAHERAAEVLREAAARVPSDASFRYNYAIALMYAGENDAAAVELEAAIELNLGYGLPHLMLSRLRRQTADANHLVRLKTLADDTPSNSPSYVYAHVALGKEYEDLGDYPRAWEHYHRGKRAARPVRANSRRDDDAMFDALHAVFDAPHSQADGYSTDEPIFVVGMPRTGTTLIERILSSHPYVYNADELSNFGIAVKQIAATHTPHVLDAETVARAAQRVNWAQLGEHYLDSTRPQTERKPHFVDKRPHNFLYIGFIARALPRAKIVCLRRHPMDTCLSNYRELFALGSPFHDYSLDLENTGHLLCSLSSLDGALEKAVSGTDSRGSVRRIGGRAGGHYTQAAGVLQFAMAG